MSQSTAIWTSLVGTPPSRCLEKRLASDEIAFVEPNKALQPGLQRRTLGNKISAPMQIPLLDAHRLIRQCPKGGRTTGRDVDCVDLFIG